MTSLATVRLAPAGVKRAPAVAGEAYRELIPAAPTGGGPRSRPAGGRTGREDRRGRRARAAGGPPEGGPRPALPPSRRQDRARGSSGTEVEVGGATAGGRLAAGHLQGGLHQVELVVE